MTTKTYKSPSSISINVILNKKDNFRIQFKSKTIGGSTYSTSDQQIQEAMERHYDFGKLFFLTNTVVEKEETMEDNIPSCPEETEQEEIKEESITSCLKTVSVSDLETAKDYLATTFGAKKSDMRSKKSVMDIAMSHNIEFVGL